MRRTSITLLITFAVLAAAIGWLGQIALTAGGMPTLTPPASLSVVLIAIAVLVLGVGWPVRQAVRGASSRRIDPFRAMRVVVLAKTSSFTGSLVAGAALGTLLHFVTRGSSPVTPQVGLAAAAFVCAVVLVAVGLVVERWCRLPPDDDADLAERARPPVADRH